LPESAEAIDPACLLGWKEISFRLCMLQTRRYSPSCDFNKKKSTLYSLLSDCTKCHGACDSTGELTVVISKVRQASFNVNSRLKTVGEKLSNTVLGSEFWTAGAE